VTPTVAPSRVGRDGALRLVVERRGPRSVLTSAASTLPLQVLAPLALDDPAAIVSVLNPTGGLVGGDRLCVDVEVGDGAHACLTTPSATKVYRTAGPPAEHRVRLTLGRGGALEWVPDHTIPFAGSALVQTIEVELAATARLILVDAFAAGRVARGEAWRFGRLESALRVRDARGWLLIDRLRLGPTSDWSALGLAEGSPYVATLVIAGPGAAGGLADDLTRALASIEGARAGVAVLPRGGLVVRCLASTAPALGRVVETGWRLARPALLGLAPPSLRKL
jgi:urease accessory protein